MDQKPSTVANFFLAHRIIPLGHFELAPTARLLDLDGVLQRVCRFHIVRICRINKGADRPGKEAQQQR